MPQHNITGGFAPEKASFPADGVRFKLLVFRMPEDLKMKFKMALLKNHLDIQHTFEGFAEVFIAWTEGEKMGDAMKSVVKRSITLMNGV